MNKRLASKGETIKIGGGKRVADTKLLDVCLCISEKVTKILYSVFLIYT